MNVVDFPDFGGADARIVATLIAISKKTRSILGLRLAEIGLMTGEDDVVCALEHGKAVSISELSRSLAVRLPTMERVVDSMVERGVIARVAGSVVRLSEKGCTLAPQIAGIRSKVARDLLSVLGAERLERLASDLEDLDAGLGSSLKTMT